MVIDLNKFRCCVFPNDLGYREVVDFVRQGLRSADPQRALYLREDHPEVSNGDDMTIGKTPVQVIDNRLHPRGCHVPAFATGRSDISWLFPVLPTDDRVPRRDLREAHPVPKPEVQLSEAGLRREPSVPICVQRVCRLDAARQIRSNKKC